MKKDGGPDEVPELTESQKVFRTLREHLIHEEFDKALQICNNIRAKTPDDLDAVRVKCLCLIYQDKYDKALQAASGKHKNTLAPERAYCLFRLERHEDALEVARSAGGIGSFDGTRRGKALAHLEAQALYRLGRHGEAAEVYDRIARDDFEEARGGKASALTGTGTGMGSAEWNLSSTVSVNLAASCTAAGRSTQALKICSAEEAMEEDGVPWELLYNLGSALIQREEGDDLAVAEGCLDRAEEVCRKMLAEDGRSEDEALDEAAIIRCQLAYARGRAGKISEAVEVLKRLLRSGRCEPMLSLLVTTNIAALGGFRDDAEALKRLQSVYSENSEKGLLPRQREACRLGRCLLLLKSGKLGECREEVDEVKKLFPDSHMPYRVAAALLSEEGKVKEATDLLQARLQQAEAGSEEEVHLKLAVCQLLVSRGNFASAAKVLRGLEPVRGTPGAASALARWYLAAGDREAAVAVVEEAVQAAHRGEHGLEGEARAAALLGMANWFQHEGFHTEAAAAYSKLLDLGAELDSDVRVQAQASLVVAYSYFDSDKAEEESRKLPYDEALWSTGELDPVELENTEFPCSGKMQKLLMVEKTVPREEKASKPNREAVLRKRAREREKYLAKLVANGKLDPRKKPPIPDPERWIPRTQRSYSKRGRKRNKFVGAQGSGDGATKDAARLDAHAKAKARQEASTKDQVLPPVGVVGKRGKRR